MNPRKYYLFLLAIFGSLLHQGCLKDTCTRSVSYTRLEPNYVNMPEVREMEITYEAPRPIEKPGKVASYSNRLLVNEKGKGIHVFDNTDPANPINTGFVSIPGNYNFLIKNGFLFANNYVDLLVFELNGLEGSVITDQLPFQPSTRLQEVFHAFWENDAVNEVAFSYNSLPATEVVDCATYGDYVSNKSGQLVEIASKESFSGSEVVLANSLDSALITGAVSPSLSDASIAQFTIIGDELYAIKQETLAVFDIAIPTQPTPIATYNFTNGILKLGNLDSRLTMAYADFVQTLDFGQSGTPSISNYYYLTSACDYLASKDGLVFATKNNHSECNIATNELVIFQAIGANSSSSQYIFPMQDPHGLTFQDNFLILCDGVDGLKIYGTSDLLTLPQSLIAHIEDINAIDVQLADGRPNLLVVTASDGVYQYDFQYQVGEEPVLLSKIAFN